MVGFASGGMHQVWNLIEREKKIAISYI